MGIAAKRAIVAGATGLVGSQLLRLLLEDSRYDQVIALTRKPLAMNHPKLREERVTLDTLATALPNMKADDWFCALGTTRKQAGSQEAFRMVDYEYPLALGRQAAETGAAQFLLISAPGASPSSSIFYSRVKGEVERDLADLGLPKLHIFRPSLLLGQRSEHRRGERFWGVAMKALNPLLIGSWRKYRAVQGEAVAAAMIRTANDNSPPGIHWM
jgi:uncharacterized protein YbjT (DUF2867 family)